MGNTTSTTTGLSPRPESIESSAASPARLLSDAPVPPAVASPGREPGGAVTVSTDGGEAVTKRILEVPLEDAVEVLGVGESLVMIEKHDGANWLVQDTLGAVREYRMTKDSAGRAVVLMPSEATR